MNFSKLNKMLTIYTVLLFLIALYHCARLLDFQIQFMERIYHISHNLMIVAPMYYIRSIIKPNFKIYKKLLVVSSLYFIYKIVLNIAFMFEFFRIWQSQFNRDIWSLSLSIILLTLLITLKLQKNG